MYRQLNRRSDCSFRDDKARYGEIFITNVKSTCRLFENSNGPPGETNAGVVIRFRMTAGRSRGRSIRSGQDRPGAKQQRAGALAAKSRGTERAQLQLIGPATPLPFYVGACHPPCHLSSFFSLPFL